MTQTPEYISVSPGQTVTMTCTASRSLTHSNGYNYLAWYQQKDQQPPKLLIYHASTRPSGIPDRFSGSGSGTNYKLTINGATADDEGRYYCQQGLEYPLTQ
uniref:Ig-like domain-containing protein n=1 Tax=Pyxicephalus adspersus TaxID=30357 RepID=A0AAV3AXQ3_PYXAD|nr:TPA: hypothetical protein GDO54_009676 [Pyxicephalus adspersus]